MAIFGLELQQNLFVTKDDSWDAQVYVRRYRFCTTRVTVDGQEQAKRVACIEKRALQLTGQVLYDDKGAPLPVWKNRLKLLFEFEADLARTEQMCKQFQELQLLETFAAQAVHVGEPQVTLTGSTGFPKKNCVRCWVIR